MKKKLFTLAGAMMLVVAMASSAMAAPVSSVRQNTMPEIKGEIVASNGTKVTADDITIAESAVAVDLKDEDVAKLVSKVENATVASLFDVSLANSAEVFANGGSVQIPFTVEGIAGKTVVVLHYNGTAWEVVPSTVSGNVVTATFTSLSPVAIVTSAKTVESPQTGVMGMQMIAVAGVALCAAVLVLSVKKARA